MSSRPLLSPFKVISSGDMNAASITSDVTMIQNLSLISYGLSWVVADPINSKVNAAGGSTTVFVTALTSTTTNKYVGWTLTFTSGANNGQSQVISGYNGTTKAVTTAAFTDPPANQDTFTITPANPVGTVSVQVSNEHALDPSGAVSVSGSDWSELTSGAVSGSPGSLFFNLADVAAQAIRLVYTKTSGAGALQATITGKVQ